MNARVYKPVALLLNMAVLLLGARAIASAVTEVTSRVIEDENYLNLVKTGTRHNYLSVSSCVGSAEISFWRIRNGQELEASRKFLVAWDGTRLKISSEKVLGPVSPTYLAVFDGLRTTFWGKELFGKDSSKTARIYAGIGPAVNGDWMIYLDPRVHGMMDLSGIDNLRLVCREVLNGDDCLVVEHVRPSPDGKSTNKTLYWVDVDKGFSIVKRQAFSVSDQTGEILLRDESYGLKSYGTDIWGPARYLRTDYDLQGNKSQQISATYNFELNTPVNEDEFSLTLPSGTEVYDETLKEHYTVP